ncbi:hypothetical protein FACS189432_07800 [Bacteroidia bacterium]|nr:hypothetical protein FACS189432_07800 [Bacteroidia bacterium]
MKKKFLIGIYTFFLSLPVIGQKPYYLAEQTSVIHKVDPNDHEWQSSKYKFELKCNANGYKIFYASYYFDTRVIENDNITLENHWVAWCKCDWAGISKEEYIDGGIQLFYEWDYNIDDWIAVKKIEREHDSKGNMHNSEHTHPQIREKIRC